jgi:PAS domain S-box-containing protein
MEEVLIDKYRLRFPGEVERAYQEESFHKDLRQLRINMTVTALVYAFFGILDAWVTPEVRLQAWFIRFAVVIPTVIFVLSLSFSRHFMRYQQAAVSFLVLVGGGGIVALIAITNMTAPYFHFAGLLLVFMCAYTSFKLRFYYATVVSWSIIGLYELSAVLISHPPLRVFLTDNFFYISANLLGMFANYQRELYTRKEFLQTRRMREMEQQKHAAEKGQLNAAVDRAVQSLKESEGIFRALAETTTASIIIHRGGRFLYANHAVQTITGFTHDELLCMDFWEIVHPEYREMVRERGRARISGRAAPAAYEFKIRTRSGEERWVTASAGFIEYAGAPAIIATLFDITDRKRAEEEKLRLYEERIREEQRHLTEKENMLMELHDGVGGITTNISILSELAQKSNDLAAVRNTLATISRLSRDGISEIRSFMRSLDAGQLNWQTLAAELRNQGTSLLEPHAIAFAFEASIDEQTAVQPGGLLCVGLFKIYKEALTNIIKHAKAASVTVTLRTAGQVLRFTVQDDGIGIGKAASAGRGLSNMQKRAVELGGTMALSTDGGTLLELSIPLPFQRPDPAQGDPVS